MVAGLEEVDLRSTSGGPAVIANCLDLQSKVDLVDLVDLEDG